MDKWIVAASAFFQILLLILKQWFSTSAEKKAEIKTIKKELSDAIKNKDISSINSLIERSNRV